MKVGLIGLPEVGKTTIFNALTRQNAETHAYGARSEAVNLGSVVVPDRRFSVAVGLCQPKKQVPASIEVVDGGARVELHERGEKFGTDFFAGVRNMDALVLVLRAYETDSLPTPTDGLDPRRDADRIVQELILADLTVVEGRLERLEKNRLAKRITPAEMAELQALLRIKDHLEGLRTVRTLEFGEEEEKSVRSFAFVSGKPLILALNTGESDIGCESQTQKDLESYAAEHGLQTIVLSGAVEAEIAQMSPEEEADYLLAMGIAEPARSRLIRAAYAALGYMSFLTVGEDEVRAWTVRTGTTALGCAERIHTDIARTFIRAEVMAFADFEGAGGWDQAKAAGKMRLEGKEYVVRDGEIVHIRNSKG